MHNTQVKPSVYVDPGHGSHDPGGLPDNSLRIDACLKELRRLKGLEMIPATPAPIEALLRVHDESYLNDVKKLCDSGGGAIVADTVVSPGSFDVAVRAAGACCEAVSAAIAAQTPSFCLIRPPGHHASARHAMGFCIINNAAVAATHALELGAERVMILDFDVHHGNGTQEIFWSDPRVLYLSLHQWPWYPWSGALEEIGEGAGLGATVNIPLPAMSGDMIYTLAVQRIVIPILRQFAPDLLIVSAGYDAHRADPLSLMEISDEGFQTISRLISGAGRQICGNRLVFCLEGGYDPTSLAKCVAGSVEAMMSTADLSDVTTLSETFPPAAHALKAVAAFLSERWSVETM